MSAQPSLRSGEVSSLETQPDPVPGVEVPETPIDDDAPGWREQRCRVCGRLRGREPGNEASDQTPLIGLGILNAGLSQEEQRGACTYATTDNNDDCENDDDPMDWSPTPQCVLRRVSTASGASPVNWPSNQGTAGSSRPSISALVEYEEYVCQNRPPTPQPDQGYWEYDRPLPPRIARGIERLMRLHEEEDNDARMHNPYYHDPDNEGTEVPLVDEESSIRDRPRDQQYEYEYEYGTDSEESEEEEDESPLSIHFPDHDIRPWYFTTRPRQRHNSSPPVSPLTAIFRGNVSEVEETSVSGVSDEPTDDTLHDGQSSMEIERSVPDASQSPILTESHSSESADPREQAQDSYVCPSCRTEDRDEPPSPSGVESAAQNGQVERRLRNGGTCEPPLCKNCSGLGCPLCARRQSKGDSGGLRSVAHPPEPEDVDMCRDESSPQPDLRDSCMAQSGTTCGKPACTECPPRSQPAVTVPDANDTQRRSKQSSPRTANANANTRSWVPKKRDGLGLALLEYKKGITKSIRYGIAVEDRVKKYHEESTLKGVAKININAIRGAALEFGCNMSPAVPSSLLQPIFAPQVERLRRSEPFIQATWARDDMAALLNRIQRDPGRSGDGDVLDAANGSRRVTVCLKTLGSTVDRWARREQVD
ncbi:hypothetical protein LTR66_002604 [Elasticomyces elasticus]|nr:hypothetical protein LTR66_002604 [Elasticomyces elasticus]